MNKPICNDLKCLSAVVSLIMMVLTISSCSKEKMDAGANVWDAARVKVVNASPGLYSINIGFDADRLDYNFFNYTDYTGYVSVTTGINVFHIYRQGSATALLSKNMNFERNKYYTVFITDTLNKLNAISITDSSTVAPGSDSVKLRFANMSPDAGALSLYIQGQTTPVVSNIAFGNANYYIEMKAANDVTFEVRPMGSNTVLATLSKVHLMSEKFYTIMSSGYQTLKGERALQLNVIVP